MKKYLIFIIVITSFLSFTFADINGNFKNYFIFRNGKSDSQNTLQMYNTFRLILTKNYDEKVVLNSSYELADRVIQKKTNGFFPNLYLENIFIYRTYDINVVPVTNKHFNLYQNLDRLLININSEKADFTIGRQPIGFGVSKIVSPIDIIIPYAYYAIDSEYRIGVDAFRGTYSISSLSNIDFGYVFGKDFHKKNSLYFLKYIFNIEKNDFCFLLEYFQKCLLLGGYFQRPIKDAGFWIEGGYVLAKSDQYFLKANDYLRLSVGLDYNFTPEIYGYIEYHYNGAGTGNKDNYYLNRYQIAYTKGSVYLLGKHYIAPGVNVELTPLLYLNTLLLFNISDYSLDFEFNLEYSLSDNLYLDFNGLIGIGTPNTEFRLLPNRFYLSLRYYF